MFCSKCGAKNKDGAKFCTACGNKLVLKKAADTQIPPQSAYEAQTPPVFISPESGSDAVPAFTAPNEGAQTPPAFTTPEGSTDAPPKFTSPESSTDTPPKFTSPEGSTDTPPKFTAPGGIPRFTVPGGTKACFHHPAEQAVAACARCGNPICRDCADSFQVSAGEYEGKNLCFDCCESLVEENVAGLKANKNRIMVLFILEIIGFVIGFIIGAVIFSDSGAGAVLLGGLLIGCVGATIVASMKELGHGIADGFREWANGTGWFWVILTFIFRLIIIEIKAIILTIKNTVYYISYLVRTSKFIEEDTQALTLMREQLAFTLVRSQNRGVDIETLIADHPELASNSYAQYARANGETAAEENIRTATTRINEHGEIIREFAAAA